MLPIAPTFCFYWDTDNNIFVSLRVWLALTSRDIDYSGGRAGKNTQPVPPSPYLTALIGTLQYTIEHPALDTLPDIFDMKPASDNVVIKQFPPEEKTPKGIIIPASAKQDSLLGEVLAVGPGQYNRTLGKLDPMTAQVGNHVMYDKFAGTPLLYNGQPCIIMEERFIKLYLDEAAT